MDELLLCQCGDCGKRFKSQYFLARHQNKKRPCIVRNLTSVEILDPLRCEYCRNLFSTKGNLSAHQRQCSKRKSESDILLEQNKELEAKILAARSVITENQSKIDHNLRRIDAIAQQKAQQCINREAKRDELVHRVNKFKRKDTALFAPADSSTRHQINDYTRPNISYLWIIRDLETNKSVFAKWIDEKHYLNVVMAIIKYIWFNKDHPENQSIRDNTPDQTSAFSDEADLMENGQWMLYSFTAAAKKLRECSLDIVHKCFERLNSVNTDPQINYSQLFKEKIMAQWSEFNTVYVLDSAINFMVRRNRTYSEQEITASFTVPKSE
ncbi:MAG: hypothetical protein M0R33_22315 [Methylomonas sp.]|jgi:hypothetical protein|uniref:C2H2-type zinc finger protein n=1 Tax=Methylomonas sp. TaxID=418 RepID=UPI0025D29F7C|nr:C2H2-type zinc finger protein [Methylomonas sp.]MCK9609179.1 hypothetical protein [Methylomonas sp.]